MGTESELCPDCGEWRPVVEETGFCLTCTRDRFPRYCICSVCNSSFNSTDKQLRTICVSCENERWLEKNADRLEAYMGIGLSFGMAVNKVMFDNRPVCLCCGNKMKGGQNGRHYFCRTNPQCRKASRRYVYYWQTKGMTKADALREVVKTLATKAA